MGSPLCHTLKKNSLCRLSPGLLTHSFQTISQNKTTVISRVGDEGLDITNLETVIEIDFLFGSRRQELQRFGRLLHSRYRGKYVIIMTKEEYVNYRKRLLSLFEKGFEVDVQEVSK